MHALRKSLVGVVLIAALVGGYYFSQESNEERYRSMCSELVRIVDKDGIEAATDYVEKSERFGAFTSVYTALDLCKDEYGIAPQKP